MSRILGSRCEIEMRRSNTNLLVAAMTDTHSCRNVTETFCVGNPVNRKHPAIQLDLSIARFQNVSSPVPTCGKRNPLRLLFQSATHSRRSPSRESHRVLPGRRHRRQASRGPAQRSAPSSIRRPTPGSNAPRHGARRGPLRRQRTPPPANGAPAPRKAPLPGPTGPPAAETAPPPPAAAAPAPAAPPAAASPAA